MFRHPLHPMLVHFPLALLASTSVWDLLAIADDRLWLVAFYNCLIGLVTAVLAVGSGLLDLKNVPGDEAVGRALTRHITLVGVALMAYLGSLLARGGPAPLTDAKALTAVLLAAVGLLALGLGGYFGAELVYTHQVGRSKTAHHRAGGDAQPPEHAARAEER